MQESPASKGLIQWHWRCYLHNLPSCTWNARMSQTKAALLGYILVIFTLLMSRELLACLSRALFNYDLLNPVIDVLLNWERTWLVWQGPLVSGKSCRSCWGLETSDLHHCPSTDMQCVGNGLVRKRLGLTNQRRSACFSHLCFWHLSRVQIITLRTASNQDIFPTDSHPVLMGRMPILYAIA